MAHLAELCEQERGAALGFGLLEHGQETSELGGAPVEAAAVAEEEGGVVADLLEAQQEEQDLGAAALTLGFADALEEGLRRGAIERGLLAREADPFLRLDLVGKVGRDGRVGLRAAQEERGGEAPEALAGDGVVVPLDGDGDCLLYTSPSPRDRTRSRMPSSA